MLVYDVKLPHGETRAPWIEPYEIADASVRRNDDAAFVVDCLMPPDVEGVAIRHYSFPNRWWSANIFLELDGSLRTGIRGFAFDCDITTPHFEMERALCNIDLKLDVFVRPDGRSHIVTDHDHFEDAIGRGFIDDHDRTNAERGLEELLALVASGGLQTFLEEICPLCAVDDAAEVRILPHRAGNAVLDYWRTSR